MSDCCIWSTEHSEVLPARRSSAWTSNALVVPAGRSELATVGARAKRARASATGQARPGCMQGPHLPCAQALPGRSPSVFPGRLTTFIANAGPTFKRAGLPRAARTGVRFHDLRHVAGALPRRPGRGRRAARRTAPATWRLTGFESGGPAGGAPPVPVASPGNPVRTAPANMIFGPLRAYCLCDGPRKPLTWTGALIDCGGGRESNSPATVTAAHRC